MSGSGRSSPDGPAMQDAPQFEGRYPTLREIAAIAELHMSTVSRSLDAAQVHKVNPKTAARVRELAARYGYRPDPLAVGLRVGRTSSIGILIADIGDAYLAPVLRGIQDGLAERGTTTVIAETRDQDDRRDRALRLLLRRRLDALIVTSARVGDEKALARYVGESPVVLCLRGLPGSSFPSVTTDDRLGGELAAGYLAQLGHRNVAQIGCQSEVAALAERSTGFAVRAEKVGCNLIETPWQASAPTLEEGRRLTDRLLASSDTLPTAIFAQTDAMAIGAISALRASGFNCPQDVSVIGFNDSPLTAYLDPPLTTIRVAGYEVGRKGAQLALDELDGVAGRDRDIVLPPQLVVRSSTRHAPAK